VSAWDAIQTRTVANIEVEVFEEMSNVSDSDPRSPWADLALALCQRTRAAEHALAEARGAIRLIRTRHGECSCLGCQEGMRVLAAASPGPNNAEKEGPGRGENEGEREP
jgi:hypothetical protein